MEDGHQQVHRRHAGPWRGQAQHAERTTAHRLEQRHGREGRRRGERQAIGGAFGAAEALGRGVHHAPPPQHDLAAGCSS